MRTFFRAAAAFVPLFILACSPADQAGPKQAEAPADMAVEESTVAETAAPVESAGQQTPKPASYASDRLAVYKPVTLEADLSNLTPDQQRMVGLLIDAADIMNGLFWQQAYGDRAELMQNVDNADVAAFAQLNYGPWDRLADNRPFVDGVGEKLAGANYYPADMTDEEFTALDTSAKDSQYTLLRRDEAGELQVLPYNEVFRSELQRAAGLLRQAAQLAENDSFARYLRARADALTSNNYQPSDLAWMDVKDNAVDVVIGPIETYEDQRYGYKAAFEGFVLLRDAQWSQRLARFAQYLPDLQRTLPVESAYRSEKPGSDADLNAYDVVYYAGDANAGAKTIAINLPNDEQVQLEKGTRRLQLKNAMRAKFDHILQPISQELIAEDQRQHVTFDAFFENTMFHEVAHGLGIKNTINDKGTVREALKEHASALEEGKADVLGLWMITQLAEAEDTQDMIAGTLKDNYVTFLASIFRSVRFGASSAHGRANMIRFNYFRNQGAFERDAETGAYRVNFDAMRQAMTDLSGKILRLQGDGDYEGVSQLVADQGQMTEQLEQDLARLAEAEIPVDIRFEQGRDVLGL